MRTIMKKHMDMSYKKMISVSLHINSPKNLILRQRYALELVALLNDGKRIINVDESFLGMTDFRRRKWVLKGQASSITQF